MWCARAGGDSRFGRSSLPRGWSVQRPSSLARARSRSPMRCSLPASLQVRVKLVRRAQAATRGQGRGASAPVRGDGGAARVDHAAAATRLRVARAALADGLLAVRRRRSSARADDAETHARRPRVRRRGPRPRHEPLLAVSAADDGESRAPAPPRKSLSLRSLYVGVIDFLQVGAAEGAGARRRREGAGGRGRRRERARRAGKPGGGRARRSSCIARASAPVPLAAFSHRHARARAWARLPGFSRHLENPAARCPSRLGVFPRGRTGRVGRSAAKCIKTFEGNKATEPPPFYARRFAAYFDQKAEWAAEAWAPVDDGAAAEAPAAANGSGFDVFVDVDAEAALPLPEGAVRSRQRTRDARVAADGGTDIAAHCLPK